MSTEHLVARFYDHPRLDVEESRKSGTKVYETVTMVELRNRGERGESYSEIVKGGDTDRTEYYKAAFPNSWAKYKGEGSVVSGHLLNVLSLDVGEIAMLEGMDIKTVEELATINDATILKVRGGIQLKQKADKWLRTQDAIKQGNVIDMLEEMKARIAELETENSQLSEKRKPGRPKKDTVDGNTDAQAVM
jgi:hypothetical protein